MARVEVFGGGMICDDIRISFDFEFHESRVADIGERWMKCENDTIEAYPEQDLELLSENPEEPLSFNSTTLYPVCKRMPGRAWSDHAGELPHNHQKQAPPHRPEPAI
jgi:hypothetical protein